ARGRKHVHLLQPGLPGGALAMARQITIEVLMPFLQDRFISEDQLTAVESRLLDVPAAITFEDGVATLLHVDVVLRALEAIDEHPWKDESAVEFREALQSAVRATGVKYWIIGADTLPLED